LDALAPTKLQEFTTEVLKLEKNFGVDVKLGDRHWREYHVGRVKGQLYKDLQTELARMRGGKAISRKRLKLYETTMYQHRQFQATESYPYAKSNPSSIEHPKHCMSSKHFGPEMLLAKRRFSFSSYAA
jgi:hypothetical protein